MGSSTAHHTAHSNAAANANDSIFGMALTQAFMGFAFGAGVDMAWEAAEIGSGFYTDRSSTVQKPPRANGAIELGVKNSLGPVFGQQTRPVPAVDFEAIIPYWLRHPAPSRAAGYGYGRAA